MLGAREACRSLRDSSPFLHRAKWSRKYDSGAVIGPQPLLASKCTLKKRCGTVRPLTGCCPPPRRISQHGRPSSNRSAWGLLGHRRRKNKLLTNTRALTHVFPRPLFSRGPRARIRSWLNCYPTDSGGQGRATQRLRAAAPRCGGPRNYHSHRLGAECEVRRAATKYGASLLTISVLG
jgi:hypothetical protein